jgi:hypothetical protein
MKNIVQGQAGGIKAFRKSTPQQCRKLISTMFDEFPLIITKSAFAVEARSVDFDRIWRMGMAKWQKACKLKSVNLAMATLKHWEPVNNGAAAQDKLCDTWRGHINNQQIKELRLGGVLQVPFY